MRSSVTQEEVFTSIELLIRRGEWPHWLKVREELGGRGSKPTLSRMISAWYLKYGPTFAKVEPGRSMVEKAFQDVTAAFDLSAIRTEQQPGEAVGAAFVRIATTLAQLHSVMEDWETDLARREIAIRTRQEALQSGDRYK